VKLKGGFLTANEIKCPNCNSPIPVDKIIIQQVKDQIKKESEVEFESKIALAKKEAAEAAVLDKNKELETTKIELELKNKKLAEARDEWLKMHKEKLEFEEQKKNFGIESQKILDEEKKILADKIHREEEEKQNFKLLEMQKQLEDTKKALSEAQRKAHQGSMQTQGEVLELSIEEALKHKFPMDEVNPVPKGINGADIIQTVYSKSGQLAGLIAWESKHTKAWTEEWVQKLKDDGRNVKANICVLVSDVLPKEINHLGIYKGIWVTDFASFIGLTIALRNQLIAINNTIAANTGKEEKKDILYNYLCSPTFANRIESIVETFMSMKEQLEKEKIHFTRIWSARDTQITRLTENTVKMYGEIQGIAGSQLPPIEILELETTLPKEEIELSPKISGQETPKEKIKEKPINSLNNQFNLFSNE